ncbi:MAG: STAS domain-containing protein [Leptospiraceae bacterium]|nr:STAS domain-containing protein [Leptospiraceae bacterium]
MKARSEVNNRVAIITVDGDINLYEIQILRDEFDNVRNLELKKLIIDLTNVDFIDSSGVGLLISQSTKFQEKKVDFMLVGIKSGLEHLFRLTSFARLFKRFSKLQDAIDF